MGFLSVSNVVPFSELESSLISLAGSHCTSTWQEGDKRKRKWLEGRGSDYLRETINWGTAIIWGNMLLMISRVWQ